MAFTIPEADPRQSGSAFMPELRQAFTDLLITPHTPEVDSSNISIPSITSDDVFIRGTNIDTTAGNLSVIAFSNPAADQAYIGAQNLGPGATAGGRFFIATRPAGGATLIEGLTVSSDQKVGIGTVAPGNQLEISKAVAAGTVNYLLKLRNATAGVTDLRAGIQFQTNNSGSEFGATIQGRNDGITGAGELVFGNVNAGTPSEWVRINYLGNVGVGIVPISLLHIAKDATYTNATQAQFYITGSDTNIRLQIGMDTTAEFGFIQATHAGVATKNLALNPLGGNVGIGTTTVSARLHAVSTTEQLRLGYDASSYSAFTVSSGGDLTVAPSGGDTSFTGTLSTTGRIHALITTEQARLSYDASNYAAFTVSSAGLLTIAPTASLNLAPAANVGIGTSTFGASAVRNFVIADGTAPTGALPAGSHIWSKLITSLVTGGTGTSSSSLGSQLFFQPMGATFRCHVAIGDPLVNPAVDQDIGGSYGREALNVRAHYSDFAAVDSATGFVPGKFQNGSLYMTLNSTTALGITSEVYGLRSLVNNVGVGSTTHLGNIYAGSAEYLNGDTSRVNQPRGFYGLFNQFGVGNVGQAFGIQGRISTSISSGGLVDFASVLEGGTTLAGDTRFTSLRGFNSALSLSASITSVGIIVDNFYGFRATTPTNASTGLITYLAGFDCFDQSGITGVTTAWNYRSRGAASVNSFEGLTSFGSASAPVSKVSVLVAPTASANFGTVSIGSKPFDGSTSGFYTGAAGGTHIAINAASATPDFANWQVSGVSVFKVTSAGILSLASTAPSIVLTDTTGSAKSLTIAVDANLAQFRESAGASGSLMVLDLANNRLGLGTAAPASMLHLAGPSGVGALTLDTPGTSKIRLQTISGVSDWGAFSANAGYSGGWNLDATASNGWFFKMDIRGGNGASTNNGLFLFRIPNGANPHSDEAARFGVTEGWGYFAQSLGVGGTPATSCALDVQSTTGAFMPPRMTTTQRDALTAADGMVLYNVTTGALNYRKAGVWTAI